MWFRPILLGWLVLLPWGSAAAGPGEWSGYAGLELRLFQHPAALPRQSGAPELSLELQPEYYREWNQGHDSFSFVPYLRLDDRDARRSHGDIRELTWLHAARDWELRLGIRKVFWGVLESAHLVDIINQTDLVEDPDEEDKLGQPMLNLAWIRPSGTWDLFLMPLFRERSFPGPAGRLRTRLPVDSRGARYESAAGRHHLDVALRWFGSRGPLDLGLAAFHGTSREPRLLPGGSPRQPVLVPFYDLIDQVSVDAQLTLEDWLLKLEALGRAGQGRRFARAGAGFEYSFVGIGGSALDLGVIGEYLFDSRGENATTPFQHDLMTGLRLSFNDAQSTEILAGITFDRDSRERFYNLEADHRLGDRWKLRLEARLFSGFDPASPFAGLRADDYLQLELAAYF